MKIYQFAAVRRAAFALAVAAAVSGSASAQAVFFPQQEQPGVAVLAQEGTDYVLSNDLLSATFIHADGRLTFGGCEAMNLNAGTELFTVTLGTGTVVKASEMTLGAVRAVDLAGNAEAVRGSERFAGKAIEAEFTSGNLEILWRAVLRDGSHYLRTELEISAKANTAMKCITPMIYEMATAEGVAAPVVVGNTRGAVLASDRMFAGVESPMGINTASDASSFENFDPKSWKPESFSWAPGDETPAGILELGYEADQIVGTKGYLVFREAGENQITFSYTSGSHRLNIAGVDVVSIDGSSVVASDYHFGYTGNNRENNVYTLDIPEAGAYMLRFFMEIKTESITSSGNITYSKKVALPEIVVGDAPEATPVKAVRRVLAADATMDEGTTLTDNWAPDMWQQVPEADVPARIVELGYSYPDVKYITRPIKLTDTGKFSALFMYASGAHRLDIVGVDLVDAAGNVVVNDYHFGYSGTNKVNNTYSFDVPFAGDFTLRYFCSNRNEANTSSGNITLDLVQSYKVYVPANHVTPIEGRWNRNTTLAAGKTWKISAVVGLIAPNQARRSVLAYVERERAVPWRPFPHYNSWYELNINRNNDPNYTTNFNINQCVDVMSQWKQHLYDEHQTAVKSFLWDDGWDHYGTWTFNPNFPNGFKEADDVARAMGSNIGAWLGPVGGYGQSGNYRRAYWSNRGGMQLSNPDYYNTFLTACSNMLTNYQFNMFKFDGISAQFSSVGPDAGTTGEENAEAIIDIEARVREIKPDVFLNTTVGTWASPFWFRYSDAVWRQENDYGTIGNQGSDRERWITYRDRLVYQNFVQNSPLCPINSMMTHGVILTKFGSVSTDMSYAGIVRELRCAFACGSGMVELYCDYEKLNSISKGKLWGDIAECIKWQERNADVLPDVHWVGGNPWDGSKANVYGWAAWNGAKATLALRNPASSAQEFTFTLREALDIPEYVNCDVVLTPAFTTNQNALPGLDTETPINIDTPLTVKLRASYVYVFDGIEASQFDGIRDIPSEEVADETPAAVKGTFDLMGRRVANPSHGIYIIDGQKTLVK